MKNRLLAAFLISFSILANTVAAGGYESISFDVFKKVQPVYLMFIVKADCSREYGQEYCLAPDSVHFKGDLSLKGAKMTVAKGLLINSDEQLETASGDLGVPSDKLNFEFDTRYYKGFILKITLNDDALKAFEESSRGDTDLLPQLKYSIQANGKDLQQTVILSYAVSGQSFGIGNSVGVADGTFLPYKTDSSLDQRNATFKKRLQIGEYMLGLERWTRLKFEKGEIDENLLHLVQEMSLNSWSKDYSDEFFDKFSRKYNKVKYLLEKGKTTPLRLYGSINAIMKFAK